MEIKQLEEIVRARRFIESGRARRERLRLGLSLEHVAPPMDVEPATVARWETGSQRPRPDHALMYVRLLDQVQRAASKATPREAVGA